MITNILMYQHILDKIIEVENNKKVKRVYFHYSPNNTDLKNYALEWSKYHHKDIKNPAVFDLGDNSGACEFLIADDYIKSSIELEASKVATIKSIKSILSNLQYRNMSIADFTIYSESNVTSIFLILNK